MRAELGARGAAEEVTVLREEVRRSRMSLRARRMVRRAR